MSEPSTMTETDRASRILAVALAAHVQGGGSRGGFARACATFAARLAAVLERQGEADLPDQHTWLSEVDATHERLDRDAVAELLAADEHNEYRM